MTNPTSRRPSPTWSFVASSIKSRTSWTVTASERSTSTVAPSVSVIVKSVPSTTRIPSPLFSSVKSMVSANSVKSSASISLVKIPAPSFKSDRSTSGVPTNVTLPAWMELPVSVLPVPVFSIPRSDADVDVLSCVTVRLEAPVVLLSVRTIDCSLLSSKTVARRPSISVEPSADTSVM